MTLSAQKRMDSGLKKAIDAYHKASQKTLHSPDEIQESGPFIVAKNIPLLAFEAWSLVQESHWKLCYDKVSGDVWLYGDPSEPHETAIYWFTKEIPVLVCLLGGREAEEIIDGTGSTTRNLPGAQKEPDFSFKMEGNDGNPAVIGEIAYNNESFRELKRESNLWRTSEETQFFIGVKINNRTRGSKRDPQLKAIIWRKNPNQYREINFGKGSENTENNHLFLDIPLDCLFFGGVRPESLHGHDNIQLDLYKLRQKIISKL